MLQHNLGALNQGDDPLLRQALAVGADGKFEEMLHALGNAQTVEAAFLRGICLLHLERRSEALATFRRVATGDGGHFLSPAFCDYLTGDEQLATAMYGGQAFTEYFRVASESMVFRNMYQAVDNTLRTFPPPDDTFTIVDLGIGTARQVQRIAEWIPRYWPQVRHVHIIGVEPYDHLARVARTQLDMLTNGRTLRVTYTLLRAYAQHLDPTALEKHLPFGRVDLVNASAAIHHMRQSEKQCLLQTIHLWKPRVFILSDADSNHESTLPDLSFELIANVTSFYMHLLALMCSQHPDAETAACYRGFCFYDARNIVLETGPRRIEFHTTADRWKQYLIDAGFHIVPPRPEWLDGIDTSIARGSSPID